MSKAGCVRVVVVFSIMAAAFSLVPMLSVSQTANAEDNCGKVLPMDAIDGSTIAGGFAVGGTSLTAGAGAATATLTGAVATGSVLLGAAAFVGAFTGTCRFLDWTNLFQDNIIPIDPLQTLSSGVSISSALNCETSSLLGTTARSNSSQQSCFSVTLPEAPGGTSDVVWRSVFEDFTVNGNVFPGPDVTPPYAEGRGDLSKTSDDLHPGQYFEGTAIPTSNFRCTPPAVGVAVTTACGNSARTVFVVTSGPTANSSLGEPCVDGGLGGVCGVIPGTLMVIYRVTSPGSTIAVLPRSPVAQANGWQRVIHSDVRCFDLSAQSSRWIRATSLPYWDAQLTSRLVLPSCVEDEVPVEVLSHTVPVGLSVCAVGTACRGPSSIIQHQTMPATLTATSTAPDWAICLSAGEDCGTPVLSDEICTWGGYAVDTDFCDPTRQANSTETVTYTAPTATATVTAAPALTGQPQTTVTTTTGGGDPGGGGSVTVTVPIDPGGGLGGGSDEEDEAECWPEGFGWFNPAQWVLKPIKCALQWAFIPEGPELSEAFDGFKDELFAQFPFSLVVIAGTFLGDLGDELSSAGGSGCWGSATSWSFGDYGSVAGGDVCVGSLPVGSGQRSTVFLLMLAPMVWALLRHAWGIVAGGNRGKDDDE